jgi:hypothetical protein
MQPKQKKSTVIKLKTHKLSKREKLNKEMRNSKNEQRNQPKVNKKLQKIEKNKLKGNKKVKIGEITQEVNEEEDKKEINEVEEEKKGNEFEKSQLELEKNIGKKAPQLYLVNIILAKSNLFSKFFSRKNPSKTTAKHEAIKKPTP